MESDTSNIDDHPPEWNPGLELVVKKEGEDAAALFWLHNHASRWASQRADWIMLPSICIATVTGFFSATSNLIPPVAIGGMSILVGIFNTIGSYFKFSQRAEGHRIASLLYHKLFKEIEVQLALPRDQRKDAERMLTEIRTIMDRVSETAPLLPDATTGAFKEKFKDNGTHKPIEANGLDAIAIYSGPLARPATPRTASVPVDATPLPAPTRPDIKITIKPPPATPVGSRLAV